MAGSGRRAASTAHQPLDAVHTPDRPAGHGLNPADRSPDTDVTSRGTPSGMGRSPARTYSSNEAPPRTAEVGDCATAPRASAATSGKTIATCSDSHATSICTTPQPTSSKRLRTSATGPAASEPAATNAPAAITKAPTPRGVPQGLRPTT